MKQLNKTAYNFSVLLILIPFFIILIFLNKKESKVICMREFEIILLQTQSLSIRDRSLFMAGGGTEEKCFSRGKFC